MDPRRKPSIEPRCYPNVTQRYPFLRVWHECPQASSHAGKEILNVLGADDSGLTGLEKPLRLFTFKISQLPLSTDASMSTLYPTPTANLSQAWFGEDQPFNLDDFLDAPRVRTLCRGKKRALQDHPCRPQPVVVHARPLYLRSSMTRAFRQAPICSIPHGTNSCRTSKRAP